MHSITVVVSQIRYSTNNILIFLITTFDRCVISYITFRQRHQGIWVTRERSSGFPRSREAELQNQRLRDQEKVEQPPSHLFQSPADLRSPQLLRPEVSDPLACTSRSVQREAGSAELSSEEESVAEGSLPAAERSSREELVADVGSQGHLLLNGPRERSSWQRVCYQPLNATMTSTAAITAEVGRSGLARRTTVVEGARDFGYARRSATLRRGGARDFSPATCWAVLGRGTRDRRWFQTSYGNRGPSACWSSSDGGTRDGECADWALPCIKDPFRLSGLDGDRYWSRRGEARH